MSHKCSFFIGIAVFFAVIFAEFRPTNGDDCLKENSCVCLGVGYEINLSHLVTQSSTSPRFHEVTSTATPNVSYAYNPCYEFRQGGDTSPGSCGQSGTAVCMSNGTEYLALGTQDSVQFVFNVTTQAHEIHYHMDKDFLRLTFLTLKCEPTLRPDESSLTVDNFIVSPANETIYYMSLISPCACPNGCFLVEDDDQGLSFGSVLVLLFCLGVLMYLCGGIAFLHFVRGATGWEIIPHYDFWMDLPLLVRDGVLFAMSGCKPGVNYNRI